MLQYSCLENPLSDREVWQATVYSTAELDMTEVTLCSQAQDIFACGSSAPVRVEREGGTPARLVETLVAPSVQGHRLPLPQELWPSQRIFLSLL